MVVTAALLGMVGFVWQLQDADGSALRAVALDQMKRCTRVPAARGDITDRHGSPSPSSSGATAWQRCRRWCGRTTCPSSRPSPRDRPASCAAAGAAPDEPRPHHRDPPEGGRSTGPRSRAAGVFVVPEARRRYPGRRLSGRRTRLDRRGHTRRDGALARPASRSHRRPRRAGAGLRPDPARHRRAPVRLRHARGHPDGPRPLPPPRRGSTSVSPSTWVCSTSSPGSSPR